MPAQSQPAVYPDSVLIVQDPRTNEVGFIIPRLAAAYYRNLYFDFVPALEEQVELLREENQTQAALAQNRLQQITTLRGMTDNLSAKVATYESDLTGLQTRLEEERAARKRAQRWVRIWRTATIALGGTTAVLGVVTVLK